MLPDATRPAGLTLRVRDVDPVAGFYTDAIGLKIAQADGPRRVLEPPGAGMQLALLEDPDAPRRPERSIGLYHFALLLPDRASLAATVQRLLDAGLDFTGFADHGVSEAAYLEDPEGNGIELYRDREPDAWPREGDEIAMVTKPLPLDDLLAEADGPAGLAEGTRLGHVHLHAGDLEATGRFFERVGFSTTQTTYPGALFLAAGDYHHHVGLNRWAGDRAPPEGATGLVRVDWALPEGTLKPVVDGWTAAGLEPETDAGHAALVDPIGIRHRFAERA